MERVSGKRNWDTLCDSLIHDGRPDTCRMINKDNLGLQCYRWKPKQTPTGVVVLLHGVRAHLRLTWLAKRPDSLESKRTALLPREQVAQCKAVTSGKWIAPACTPYKNAASPDTTIASSSSGFTPSTDSTDDGIHHTKGNFMEDPFFPCAEEREKEVIYSGSWVEGFVAAGNVAYGFDIQGHGLSDAWLGKRGDVNDVDDHKDDLIQFLDEVVVPEISGLPVTVLAVSLSGLIAFRALQNGKLMEVCPNLVGLCLIAPLLKVHRNLTTRLGRSFCTLLRVLAKVRPSTPIKLPTKPETSGPEWQQRYGNRDPYLCRDPFTVHMIHSTILCLKRLSEDMTTLKFSEAPQLMFLHNLSDPVNPYYGSTETYEELKKAWGNLEKLTCVVLNHHLITEGKTAMTAPQLESETELAKDIHKVEGPLDLGHTLITDPDNNEVFDIVYSWIRKVTYVKKVESLCASLSTPESNQSTEVTAAVS